MAKKKSKTFSTEGFKSSLEKEKEKNTIHIKESQHMYINAFVGGTGVHGGTTKAQNKRSRKEGKNLCRNWSKDY